jgi:DNA-binding beta-propeller fold protein YncE
MPLQQRGFVELPPHTKAGGFDHATVHEPTGRVFVAHTANDAVDVIDIAARKYVGSIPGLPTVAGR